MGTASCSTSSPSPSTSPGGLERSPRSSAQEWPSSTCWQEVRPLLLCGRSGESEVVVAGLGLLALERLPRRSLVAVSEVAPSSPITEDSFLQRPKSLLTQHRPAERVRPC